MWVLFPFPSVVPIAVVLLGYKLASHDLRGNCGGFSSPLLPPPRLSLKGLTPRSGQKRIITAPHDLFPRTFLTYRQLGARSGPPSLRITILFLDAPPNASIPFAASFFSVSSPFSFLERPQTHVIVPLHRHPTRPQMLGAAGIFPLSPTRTIPTGASSRRSAALRVSGLPTSRPWFVTTFFLTPLSSFREIPLG